ncbi:3-phosphoserine/phosphohydroxythreonine transaminase [Falsibacillus albus]|uniref:Phosphoserine aminotransferase n=1 Tax=Falsibacillus albus TaxID=2478915 RepID=A0A3L7K3F8_9BACI|nr:3-phosphoserine/phosphohydroxythreonine transaminase [Falsibacillus albus]RLQ96844.1 3-phosphoserine/phosphohydroxythreonine transaminase [Falsibacillus albus]
MEEVYNFSAGPAVLPQEVKSIVQEELANYRQTGMSVMEMSHRSNPFQDIIDEAEALLRELMNIPDNYHVLFLQGGASLQFSMLPMNLLTKHKKAEYVLTGSWSVKAAKEAEKFGDITTKISSNDKNFTYYPTVDLTTLSTDLDYIHITTNNTIEGTVIPSIPDTKQIPLVADMSSNILSEHYDVSKFGLIYAGAQKNIGPAGLTIAIVREDLIGSPIENCPTLLNYETYSKNQSLYNTPPTFSIYVAKLVFEWLKQKGGIAAIEKTNRQKAGMLYDFIDQSKLFHSLVKPGSRSLMNIPFTAESDELNAAFIKQAGEKGLVNLKGHRSVGGMRASIYNAMPVKGVQALIDFMESFEKANK